VADSPAQRDRPLRVVWLARSFLDYRIPVFAALDDLLAGRLHMLYSADYVGEPVAAKAVEALGDRAIGMPGEWRIGPDDRHGMANAGFALRYQPDLLKRIRRCRPDVLIGDGFFKWTFVAMAYKLLHRTPLVVTYERTAHTERNAQWVRRAYRKAAIRLIDAMAVNGRLCVDYVRQLGFRSDRITTGQMAADTVQLRSAVEAIDSEAREDLRRRWDVRGVGLLYVGSLTYRKGVAPLLDAWRRLERARPNAATLLLVGEGDKRDELARQASEAGLDSVRFVGAVPYDELPVYYAAADALVIPTLEDNWSLVVPEAMACGLPILCSTYNGCWPELVHDGVNGWVFDPLCAAAAAAALMACVDRADGLAEMGRQSRRIVADHTPQRAAESILAACRMAVGRGAS